MEKQLTVAQLENYYAQVRTDSYDGPNVDGNMDWVPDDEALWIEHTTPPERDLEIEEYAMARIAMEVRSREQAFKSRLNIH